MIRKAVSFFTSDIWRIRVKDLPPLRSFFLNQLRVIILAFRRFAEDKCQLRASALTYYSLLSIVPVFAMAFGIAKGFGFEKMLEQQLTERFSGQAEVLQRVISFSHTLLENTKGGIVAGIGVIILFWSVIKVLGNIENSFNDIWGVKRGRSLGRKATDYLSIILICPFLVIVSSGATVFIVSQAKMLLVKISFLGAFAPAILFLLKFLPYMVIWVVFTFVYIFMPNTKVNFKSGIVAGILAGTLYQIVQWLYLTFQIGVTKYNAIYGSFAALPMFLVWLQTSWLVLFWGAEISFAHQNVHTYEFEPDCLSISRHFKEVLLLLITRLVIKNFEQAKDPLTASQVSQRLEIPIRLVRDILFELSKSRILCAVKVIDDKDSAYHPAQDINRITIKYVLDALGKEGSDNVPVLKGKEFNSISGFLNSFEEAIGKSPANKLIKDI